MTDCNHLWVDTGYLHCFICGMRMSEYTAPKVGKIVCNGEEVRPGVISGGSSSNGHYVGKALVEEALGLGWHDEMARGAVETYDEWYHRSDWPHFDHWHEMLDDAEEWLNEHTEGGIWHWADGDFRLDRVEECPDCGEQRFADTDIADTTCGDHLSWD